MIAALPLLALLSLSVAGCGTLFAKSNHPKQIILATEYDDQTAGQQAAQQIEAEMGLFADPELAAYVQSIGKKLLRFTRHTSFDYRFKVVDQAMPNAFSLPGGGIYLSRGLIALADDEDELACVIGHEITHAAERHAAALQTIGARSLPVVARSMQMARLAAYSREHEHSADRGGQRLAAAAGYDPMGLSRFLRKLEDTERLKRGYSRLPGYFDTHPGIVERSATTADRASTLQVRSNATSDPTSGDRTSASYLERIDGLVLGTNPAEGIFDRNVFIHPDLMFSLRLPKDWNVFNTHQAVGAVAPERDAVVELRVGPRADSAREAARILREEKGEEMHLRVERELPLKIGEIDAFRLEGSSLQEGQSVRTTITFIPHKGMMFQLASYARPGSFDKYVARIRNTARGFAPLSEPRRNAVEIVKLRVVPALENEALAELSRRTGNTFAIAETAILNGVFADTRFREGQLVKIARSEPYIGPSARTVAPPVPKAPSALPAPSDQAGDSPGQSGTLDR